MLFAHGMETQHGPFFFRAAAAPIAAEKRHQRAIMIFRDIAPIGFRKTLQRACFV
jgi:hypothetical protein